MSSASVFGYGSLINKASFERTLGRKLASDEFRIVKLNGYVRMWTLCHSVDLYSEEKRALLPPGKKYVVYLDISPSAGESIMGSLVEVSTSELSRFDTREKNYHRADITSQLSYVYPGTNAYVYIGNENNKTHHVPLDECVIIKEYVDLIEDALKVFEPSVVKEYWRSTLASPIDVISVPRFFN